MTDETLQNALSDEGLSTLHKAVSLIWHDQSHGPGLGLTPYEVSKRMLSLRIGNPNRARLEKDLTASGLVLRYGTKFRLRAGKSPEVESWLRSHTDEPVVDLSVAYIPESVWGRTRGYIEKVAIQLCGCWEHNYLDAAAVMLRRLSETLIIEAYETLNRASEIIDDSGNYMMLSGLVDKCCGANGITLGREAKTALKEIKKVGDRSAHNRRVNAIKQDLESVRSGARVAVEELIYIADLRRSK